METLRIIKETCKRVTKPLKDFKDVLKDECPACPVDPKEAREIINRELNSRRNGAIFLSDIAPFGWPIPSDEFFRESLRKKPGWKNILAKAEEIEGNNQK